MVETPDRADETLLVDLINTYYCGNGDDVLADERGPAWLRERFGGRGRVSIDQLGPLRTLREGLRQLAAANNGEHSDREVVTAADSVLRSAPLTVRLPAEVVLAAAADGNLAERAVAECARALIVSGIRGGWTRVKACADPACRWAFLDASRNGSKRWCDMSDCGNRAKNRAWRSRQATHA